MNIDAIFLRKRKNWNSLMRMRQNVEKKLLHCPRCGYEEEESKFRDNAYVCPSCQQLLTIPPKERIEMLCDEASFREMYRAVRTKDPISFPGYQKKLEQNRVKTGQEDAFVAGVCQIGRRKVAIGVLDSRFLMGSMGTAVGEKIVRLTEFAGRKKLPLILFSASGGARMQEGLFSLMQMARTAAAVERYKKAGGLFISCLTHPTTGGVCASYASLGDIMIAEPDALIGFAGPRVIEQTIGQTLPKGFQHAEFLLEHGMIDMIVERDQMRKMLAKILEMHGGNI